VQGSLDIWRIVVLKVEYVQCRSCTFYWTAYVGMLGFEFTNPLQSQLTKTPSAPPSPGFLPKARTGSASRPNLFGGNPSFTEGSVFAERVRGSVDH